MGHHPAWLMAVAAALWSINERLGGNPGLDLEPLTEAFAEDALGALWAAADALAKERDSPRYG